MKKNGFTLVELITVIVILGIVIAITIPGVNAIIKNSRTKALSSEVMLVHKAARDKMMEVRNYDFTQINKDNIHEKLNLTGKEFDYVRIINEDGKIKVTLIRNDVKVITTGDNADTTKKTPYVVFEYDLSLGQGFVNINNSDLSSSKVYVYTGSYENNKNNIESNFKNPTYTYTDLTNTTNLRTKLNKTSGIYTVVATKFSKTGSYPRVGNGSVDSSYYNKALIRVPHIDLYELGTTSLYAMFAGAENFNQNISNWDVSKITNMGNVFNGAKIFDQPLNNWDTKNVTNFYAMFYNANMFNKPLDKWNTSKANEFGLMFRDTHKFDQPLNRWDTSSSTSFRYMFLSAREFNQNINSWNVSKAKDIVGMFSSTAKFNQPLNNWDTSSVIHMGGDAAGSNHGVFAGAVSFNQPLDNWDVSNVQSMITLFYNARAFNQDLSSWNVEQIKTKPLSFDSGATAWTKSKPIWGTSGSN